MPKLGYIARCNICNFAYEASNEEEALKLAEACESSPTPEKKFAPGDVVRQGKFVYKVIKTYYVKQARGKKSKHVAHCELELLGLTSTKGYLEGAKLHGGRKKSNQKYFELVAKKGKPIKIKVYKYNK